MSRASGLNVRIEIRMGEGNVTDTPALGAAVGDLRREGWTLEKYESGQGKDQGEVREAYAVLSRSWDISAPLSRDTEGAYAMETASPGTAQEG